MDKTYIETLESEYKIGYFDLETQHWSGEFPNGFGDCDKFKMSIGCLYDATCTQEHAIHVFHPSQIIKLFITLDELDLIVGFNLIDFDYKVLKGHLEILKNKNDFMPDFDFGKLKIKTFDMMKYIHESLGFRVSLDNLANSNLTVGKSADGLQAVEWWKAGEIENIIKYCQKDVEITRQLFHLAVNQKYLRYYDKRAAWSKKIDTHQILDWLTNVKNLALAHSCS